MREGPRATKWRHQFGAFPHAPRAVYLGMRSHFGAIPRAPRVVCPQVAPPLRSYVARSKGTAPAICTRTLEPFRRLRGSRAHTLQAHFGVISRAPQVAYLLTARRPRSQMSHAPRVAYTRIAHSNFPVFQICFARKACDNPRVLLMRSAYSEKEPRKLPPFARGAPATWGAPGVVPRNPAPSREAG